jgi:hypothetical protein
MTSVELTIITAVVFILLALERVYAGLKKRETKTIECLDTIAELLREIRDDARECNTEKVEDRRGLCARFDHFEGCFANIESALSDIDMALHGDYLHNIDNRLVNISLALESDEAGVT